LEKEQIDEEIDSEFSKLAYQSWRGDNMELPPAEGKQYFASLNVNGQVLVDYTKVGTSIWSKLHELNISSAAIQDTRLQDPDQQTAAERQAKGFADGHRMAHAWSNASHLGTAEGVGLMVKGPMVSRVMKCKQSNLIQDSRGWNRFTGLVIQGKKGIRLAIISLYIPCAHSTSWQAQIALLLSKHDTRDPREVALRDVMDEMDKLGDNVRFILAGDFNLPWNDKGRNGGMDATEKRLSKLLNTLCEVRSLKPAWEALHPNKKAWTRQVSVNAQAGSSRIDHIIVSQCLLQSKAITRMGILQDEKVGSSDHRLLVMEYDLAIALNLEVMQQVHT